MARRLLEAMHQSFHGSHESMGSLSGQNYLFKLHRESKDYGENLKFVKPVQLKAVDNVVERPIKEKFRGQK
uniref:Uncharacterized protein n=1 Tax=Leersia perrieri TaxID=77586 RepID=A0A0D9VS07_9ORYZ